MTKRNSTRTSVKVQHDQKTLNFIKKSKAIHGDRFNYDKAVYVDSRSKITLTCNVCGSESSVTMCNHIYNKSGCKQCFLDRYRWTNEEFERRSREKHGNAYDYSQVNYIDHKEKVAIICRDHGVFWTRPNNHVRGSGCPECARTEQGWSKGVFEDKCSQNSNGLGKLYVLKCFGDKEVFYKVGITSRTVKKRYSSKGHLPYDFEIEYVIEDTPNFIYQIEGFLHTQLKEAHYIPKIPFKGGQTECFSNIRKVERMLKKMAKSNQLKLLA